MRALNEHKSFAFVDLGLSDEDLKLISQFKIEHARRFDYFGDLDLLKNNLPDFLRNIGNNEEHLIQKITQVIFETASAVGQASNKEAAWVSVRTSIPNETSDIRYWHWDHYYYSPHSGFVCKFAATLKGNPTLFYPLTKGLRDIFGLYSYKREILSDLLVENFIESPKPGEGALFIIGDKNSAAAHSKPKMDGKRLFFSVLPANDDEINELCDAHPRPISFPDFPVVDFSFHDFPDS